MANNLKGKAISGFAWSLGERFGSAISDFVISIIIARLLAPEEFGLVAMVMVFISLLTPFIDAGLGKALIRKKEVTDKDYSTIFWWNIAVSILVYFILYFSAPLVSAFYKEPELKEILRVVGLLVILQAFSVIQTTRLTKLLDFRSLTIRSVISNLLSGLLGLYLAFNGWSYWAIVVRQLANAGLSALLLWSISNWRPSFSFSVASFKEFFGFGNKLLLSGLLDAAFNNIYPLLIGKFFSPAALGFYNRANNLRNLPQNIYTSVVSRVTYPILAQINGNDDQLIKGYTKLIQLTSFIYFPIMLLLMGGSKLIIVVLLTEKWLPAVSLLKGLALAGILYPIHALNLNVLMIKGRSDLFLRLEVIKKMIVVIIIVVTFKWGIMGLVIGQIVYSVLALILNTFYTKRILNYSLFNQLKDILPSLYTSLAVGLSIMIGSENLGIYTWWSLIGWLLLGLLFYILLSGFTNRRDFGYFSTLIRQKWIPKVQS